VVRGFCTSPSVSSDSSPPEWLDRTAVSPPARRQRDGSTAACNRPTRRYDRHRGRCQNSPTSGAAAVSDGGHSEQDFSTTRVSRYVCHSFCRPGCYPGASCSATPTPGSAGCTVFVPRPCTATSSASARTGRAQMTSCKKPSSGPGVTCRGSAPMTGPSGNGCSVSRNLLIDADQAARSRPIAVQD